MEQNTMKRFEDGFLIGDEDCGVYMRNDGLVFLRNGERISVEDMLNNAAQGGCKYCNSEYNQQFVVTHIRNHTSGHSNITSVTPEYCPMCGRKLE